MTRSIPLQVAVEPQTLTATPQEAVSISLSVFNTSDIIDGFDIALIGADKSWVTAEPDWISLFPDTEGTVGLSVLLPSDFPAGPHDLGVKVTSRTSNEVFAVTGVQLDVTERREATMDLDPDSITTGRRGRFAVTIDNTGNVPVDLSLSADDDENMLGYEIIPNRLLLDPGEAKTCQLIITAPRPFTGVPAMRPFTVTAVGGDEVHLVAPGTISTRPWVPRWLLTILGVILLLGLWAFIVGAAIDAIIDDSDADLAAAFQEGIEQAVGGDDAAGGAGGAAGDVITGPAGTVPGTVTNDLDGRPVPGATVTATALISDGSMAGEVDPDRDPIEVAAGDDGTFAMEEMVRGTYSVTANNLGYIAPDAVVIAVPYEDDPLAIILTGQPGLVAGIVTVAGEPLPDAFVVVRRLDPDTGLAVDASGSPSETPIAAAQTPDTGRFALSDLPTPARYEVEATAPGHMPNRIVVDIAAGQELIGLELELVPGAAASLVGSVTDAASGDPLGGVTVTVTGDNGSFSTATLTSTVDQRTVGSYLISGIPAGTYTASFTSTGYVDVALPLVIAADTPEAVLDTEMTKDANAAIGTVSGVVRGGASPFTSGPITSGAGVTGPERGSRPEGSVTAGSVRSGPRTVGAGAGQVAPQTSGGRLGGVSVTLTGDGGTFTTTTLTEAPIGKYTVSGLPAGSYTATFSLAGYTDVALPVVIDPEEPEIALDVEMTPIETALTGSVTGVVRSSSTNARLGGATVTLSGAGGTFSTTSLTEAPVGSYTLSDLPTGAYTATFTHPAHSDVALTLTVSSTDPDVTLDAVLPDTVITGTVVAATDSATTPLEGVAVRLNGVTVATTAADGTYSFTLATPGTVTLNVVPDGYRPGSVTLTPTVGVTSNAGTVTLYPLVDLVGRFVDMFGRKVTGPGTASLVATGVIPANGLGTVDLSPLTWSGSVANAYTVTDAPAPATYSLQLTLPPDATRPDSFVGLYPLTFTLEHTATTAGTDAITRLTPATVPTTLPYVGGVIYGTFTCFGDPLTVTEIAVAESFGSEGNNIISSAVTDNQGRVALPHVETSTNAREYLVGVAGANGIDFEYDYVFVTVRELAVDMSETNLCYDD